MVQVLELVGSSTSILFLKFVGICPRLAVILDALGSFFSRSEIIWALDDTWDSTFFFVGLWMDLRIIGREFRHHHIRRTSCVAFLFQVDTQYATGAIS